MLLILFFLFMEGRTFTDAIYRSLPFPEDMQKDITRTLNDVIKVLLAGNLAVMILQGIIVGLGLFFCGIGSALLLGMLAAICSLIPVVGTSLVWLPPVAYFLFTGSYGFAVFLGLWCLVLNTLVENVLKPVIFGEKLHVHPLIFFFLLLGSLQTFNLPGIIIGPILLTLFFSFWEIYRLLGEYESRQAACPPREKGESSPAE
jgi:predicted PurR-regulated permease PerM